MTSLAQGIVDKLQKACPDLDDVQREVILEAVFAVATCNGVMGQQEVEVLGRVAAALHVPPAVVQLKVIEWRVLPLPRPSSHHPFLHLAVFARCR